MIRSPSFLSVFLAITLWLFFIYVVLVNIAGVTNTYWTYFFYIVGFLYFMFGLGREKKNREIINVSISNSGQIIIPIYNPDKLRANPFMRFIRVWYFGVCWPLYLYRLISAIERR